MTESRYTSSLGGPAVKTLHFYCRGLGWISGWELRPHELSGQKRKIPGLTVCFTLRFTLSEVKQRDLDKPFPSQKVKWLWLNSEGLREGTGCR